MKNKKIIDPLTRSEAKKAAFNAAYESALKTGKVDQKAVNTAYDKVVAAYTQQPKPAVSENAFRNAMSASTQHMQSPMAALNLQAHTAEKAYDDYVGSQEHKDVMAGIQKQSQNVPYVEKISGAPSLKRDPKEQELKAAADYYRQQVAQEKNRQTTKQNLARIAPEDMEAIEEYIREKEAPITDDPHVDSQHIKRMAEIYASLMDKYGKEELPKLIESYEWYLNEENAEKLKAWTKDAVGTVPGAVGHNILSVGANVTGSINAAYGRAKEYFTRTGQYDTLQPYTTGDMLNLYTDTVRGATAQNIAGEDGNIGRQALSVGYQGVMSFADTIARTLVGGKVGSLGLAAAGSFGRTMTEASKQGATPAQAAILAVGSAAIEAATEYIPLDEMLKAAKGGAKGGMAIIKAALKQAGIEATTEEIGLVGNLLYEAAVLREKSSYQQKIGELVANGASYAEAKKQADKDTWNEALNTAMVSGFSGFLSGGGSAYVGSMADKVIADTAAELAQKAPPSPAPAPMPEGLKNFDNAAAIANGVEPAVEFDATRQPVVDTAPAAEYDNSSISPALGASVGNSGVTYTSDNQAVPFQYAIVPAESLITSNDQFGNVNSAYPAELQPRDRTRTASQIQISKMAQNLNPALLAESATAENGAPIIRGDGVVVGGNARVNAIGMAYGSGNGGAYQQFITEKAAELGIDPATLPANPVLVRITNGVDNYTGLATALNETGVKTNSPSETAKIDASKMGDIIQYLSVGEDGDLNTAENREFIQQFTTHVVPSGEQDTVMQGNSQVSQAGIRRMQYALFHYAYNDTALLERLAESTDNNAKNITNAMVGTAGKVAQLQTEIGRGEVQDFGLQNAITNAVNLYLDAKAGKQTVDDAAGQLAMGDNGPEAQYDGLTVNLAKFMEANNRSGKQIRDFIDILVDVNMNMAAETATEVSMFDTGDQQTQEGLYDEAVTAYDQQRDGKGRIPEKSDFSQHRQYQPGELAAVLDGSSTEGNPGKAQLYGRSAEPVPAAAPGGQRNLTEQNPGTVGAMQSQFKHEVKQSKVYGNTYQNTPYADIHDIGRAAKKADPNIDQYDVITEAESVHEAELRTETGRDRLAEHRALMKKDGWTGADNDTAMRLLTAYRREGKKDRFLELSRKQRQMGTQAGQMVQSFAKYSREDATVAVQDAIADLDELTIDQVDRTFWKPKQEAEGAQGKKDAFQKWKENITGSLLEVANDIENVEDGDKAAMKDLVRQIANLRHTTAWAGYSSDLSRRTERGLDKMDFDTLKTVAKTQLSMIPNDFRKRDTGEILKQIRVQNMLFTLTTKFKNDAGNITNGIMDAVSDSFGGRMIDAVLGKMTGQRTVGNDLKFAKEYSKAARDAADVASAFVSLDIPMEVDAKYSSGRTRTWTPNTTNAFGRLMSAYEKHMKYALEVSDKFYEGGAAHVVKKSLQSLGEKSGLTQEQIQDIAQKTGERRTFKDPGASVDKSGQPKNGRMLARANVGLQKALNNIGTENIGLGDMVMPFAAVSGEVKQVGMDYTGGGLISGMKEIISIAKDVRNGKEIDPYRQRTAATNFGRGMTGVGLIAAFTALAAAGAVKVHNDRDSEERMMNQTQGLSGAQWNLNSSLRWWEATMNGSSLEEAAKAAEWQNGDELITIDFLEPYNTQMHIGYLLSQGEDIPTAIMQGNFNSLLEMPMMQTLSDLADLQQAFTEVSDGDMDGVRDAAGQLVGTVAGSIVPNWMRKTAQVIDPYYRDTYDTNPFRKAAKEVVAATPILSAALPKKYDNLGKEQRRFDESEWMAAAFDNLVTPWDTDTYQTNPVYQEIERLNAIDGINVTPPQAKRKITYTDSTGKEHENYNLSSEQYETMQRIQGQAAKGMVETCINDPIYKAMTDDQKAKVIKYAYDYARETGRSQALPGYEISDGWMKDVRDGGADVLIDKVITGAFTDAFGNFTDGSGEPAEDLRQAYGLLSKMSTGEINQFAENAGGRVRYYIEAKRAGVKEEAFLDLYGKYRDIEAMDLSAGDKAAKWAHTLDQAQNAGQITQSGKNSMKENMLFRYSMPANTDKYDQLTEAGLDADTALDVTKLLEGITPETGRSGVRAVQKAEAIVDYDGQLSENEKEMIIKQAVSDSQDENINQLKALGYGVRDYVKLYRDYEDYTSGSGKKRRTVEKWMKDYHINKEAATALYEVFS